LGIRRDIDSIKYILERNPIVNNEWDFVLLKILLKCTVECMKKKKTYSTGKEVFSLVLEQSNIPVEHCTKKFLLASELIKTLPKFMNGNPEAQRKYYSSSHIKNLIRNYITAHSSEVINSI